MHERPAKGEIAQRYICEDLRLGKGSVSSPGARRGRPTCQLLLPSCVQLAKGQMLGGVDGFLKLLFGTETLRLLGVHAFGEGATEIIHIGQVGNREGSVCSLPRKDIAPGVVLFISAAMVTGGRYKYAVVGRRISFARKAEHERHLLDYLQGTTRISVKYKT